MRVREDNVVTYALEGLSALEFRILKDGLREILDREGEYPHAAEAERLLRGMGGGSSDTPAGMPPPPPPPPPQEEAEPISDEDPRPRTRATGIHPGVFARRGSES